MISINNNIEKKYIKSRLINKIFVHGNKHKSEIILLKCFKSIQKSQLKKCSKEIFKISLKNSSPFFQLRSIKNKVRKNEVKIPYFLKEEMRLFYGIKNILNTANMSTNVPFFNRLKNEMLQSSNLKGKSISNKKKLHENSYLYRKYARYRWF